MSEKRGRPSKETSKKLRFELRLDNSTAEKLKKCADSLKISKTEVIEKGIDLVMSEILKE